MRVLFLCTHNAARSQMAEGWLRHLAGREIEVVSAGTAPADHAHPLAEQVMAELGIPLSGHYPKHLGHYVDASFDYVVTVCDLAAETCPVFPGAARRLRWSLPDPSAVAGSEKERLAAFRRVRDDLGTHVRAFLASVTSTSAE